MAEGPRLKKLDVEAIAHYIDQSPIPVDPDTILEALRIFVPDWKEEIMGNLTQPYFAKGLAEGRVKGRAEGEAIALVRLLEKRLGILLPDALRQRIFSADLGIIETWFERAIDDGADLESVFKSP